LIGLLKKSKQAKVLKSGLISIFILVFGLSAPKGVEAQSGITFFVNSELDRILAMAKRENKDVFIDTYTQWCVPCKKLDKVFTDREVGRYFNENFINVKFDMETEAGKVLVNKYDVFFMPTLLILDKHGNIKLKWDRGLVDAQELLKMAIRTEHPELYASRTPTASAPTPSRIISPKPTPPPAKAKNSLEIPEGHEMVIEKNPVTGSTIVTTRPIAQTEELAEVVVPKQVENKKDPIVESRESKPGPKNIVVEKGHKQVFSKSDISTSEDEKILYVMDSGEGPPDFVLYEEAYFRLQLMDGSHSKAAKAYLETQDNWLSEKNMRFLNDFLYSTNSEEFKYYIEHRTDFENLIGKNQVLQTIIILANNQLERGYPRPTLEEAEELYGLMGFNNPKESASKYYLNRLFEQDTPENYIEFASKYCNKIGESDHFEMNRLATLQATTNTNRRSIKKSIKLLNKAITLDAENFEYLESLAYVYYKAKDKAKALESIQNAKTLAQTIGAEDKLNLELLNLIEAL